MKIPLSKPARLQTNVFLAFLLLIVILVGSFSVFFYQYTSKLLVRQETSSLEDITLSFLSSTERIIKDMDTVSVNIGYSNMIKDKLGASFQLNLPNDEFSALADAFVSINGVDTKVDQINLYDFNGQVLQVGLNTRKKKADTKEAPWMTTAKELGGAKYLSLPYENYFWANNRPGWFISLYRLFYNQYGKEVGYIETSKQCKNIFKSITTYKKTNTSSAEVYIYNQEGILIYPYNGSTGVRIYDYFNEIKSRFPHNLEGHLNLPNPVLDQEELMVFKTSKYTGWTYVTVQNQYIILKPVSDFLRLLLIVTGVMLLVSILLSYYLTRTLIQPIEQLRNIIRRTELDTLGHQDTQNFSTSIDELAELNNSFQKMSVKLKSSMDDLITTKQREMKSRNLALQSQMNPHFYYNTLASISVLAENEQNQEIVAMCKNLSAIMRYITKSDATCVPLREEIDYIQKYLYCMKIRYQSSLNYEISIDKVLMNMEIPKLIIQPFVENALKYGTNSLPPWNIIIRSRLEEDRWYIDIIDSGLGFSKEIIEEIQTRFQTASAGDNMPDISINGMGILNVYLRWHLFCGKDAVFSFGNTPEGHGIVTIGCRRNVTS